jgi:hypothetical protein
MLNLVLPGSDVPRPCFAATSADRRLHLLDPLAPHFPLLQSYANLQDSPILDLAAINSKHLLIASMSGKLVLYNTKTEHVVHERKDHAKYLVKITIWTNGGMTIIATAGWDAKLLLYRLAANDEEAHRKSHSGESRTWRLTRMLGSHFRRLMSSSVQPTILSLLWPRLQRLT